MQGSPRGGDAGELIHAKFRVLIDELSDIEFQVAKAKQFCLNAQYRAEKLYDRIVEELRK